MLNVRFWFGVLAVGGGYEFWGSHLATVLLISGALNMVGVWGAKPSAGA